MAPTMDPTVVASKWESALKDKFLRTKIVPGANHKIDNPKAQGLLCDAVVSFLAEINSCSNTR